MEDGNCPVNKLLEMLSTCSGLIGVEDGNSLRPPFSLLKLTSMTMILLEDTNSCGRAPDSMLCERLSRSNPVRLPRDGEMCPWRLLEARETSVTVRSWLQVIPLHLQQSVPSSHDAARPPSSESSLMNLRRKLLSCSVHELVREAKSMRSTRARLRTAVSMKPVCLPLMRTNLFIFWLRGKARICEKIKKHSW